MPPLVPFARRYLFTIGRCARLLTLDVLRHSGRQRLKRVARVFGYPRCGAQLPVAGIGKLTPGAEAGRLLDLDPAPNQLTAFELIAVCRITQVLRPRHIFEFGTHEGRTTLNLAANSPDDAKVYTLDLAPAGGRLPGGTIVGQRYLQTPYDGKIEQLHGNSLDFDFSSYAGRMDLVFVDAGHSIECVTNDSQAAAEMLRGDGGVIIWHDYRVIDGVTRCLERLYGQGGLWRRLKQIEGTQLACLGPDAIRVLA